MARTVELEEPERRLLLDGLGAIWEIASQNLRWTPIDNENVQGLKERQVLIEALEKKLT